MVLAGMCVGIGHACVTRSEEPQPTTTQATEPASSNDRDESVARASEPAAQQEATPSAAPQSAPTAPEPALPATVRGRVVDARTGQGLPCVSVYLFPPGEQAEEELLTDVEGRFEVHLLRERMRLRFRDTLTGRFLGAVPVSPTSDELVYEAHVGPTLIVRVSGAPAQRLEWQVRLFDPSQSPYAADPAQLAQKDSERFVVSRAPWEEASLLSDGPTGAWSWRKPKLLEPDAWIARYRSDEHESTSGRPVRIQVAEPEGIWQGEVESGSAPGVHSVEMRVAPVCAVISGRVRDEDGQPVRADVIAFHRGQRLSSDEALETETGASGEWTLIGLEPGPARVLVFSPNRTVQRAEVELALGENTALDLVLPRAHSAGHVSGALVGPTDSEDPAGIAFLEPADASSPALFQPWMPAKLSTAGRALFSFEDVPPGSHRLSVLALDGRSYGPASALVTPPAHVEFTTHQIAPMGQRASHSLRVYDARTGAWLQHVYYRVRLGSVWSSSVAFGDPLEALARLAEDAPVAILVGHSGHRPALLDRSEVLRNAPRSDGHVDAELSLEPGHGAGLVVLDAESSTSLDLSLPRGSWRDPKRWKWGDNDFLPMRGLPGARIVCRGEVLGTSDELGLALCASKRPIEPFEVHLEGWTLLDAVGFRDAEQNPNGLGYVLMVRD
jgi:hypothetical protein